jgi:hypothetical protein
VQLKGDNVTYLFKNDQETNLKTAEEIRVSVALERTRVRGRIAVTTERDESSLTIIPVEP